MKTRRLERIINYLITQAILYKCCAPTGERQKKIGATLNLLDKADREELKRATSKDFNHRLDESHLK